ncbi:CBS domain-containing protein [Streptomyces sp. NPDC058572]|uniref:CBS domain-containing protein n=1 Tax=Streptomyces sp. NPDC058572 TaxID=3346546 RepID=UPI003660008A
MMKHDMVGTVMTSDVVRASTDTTFREIVHLLDEHRISGLHVVDDGQDVIGVISESDLLAHAAASEDRQGEHHARWSSLIRKSQDGVVTVTTFGGRLEEGASGWVARMILRQGRGGDFRDIARIGRWAETIAAGLVAGRT